MQTMLKSTKTSDSKFKKWLYNIQKNKKNHIISDKDRGCNLKKIVALFKLVTRVHIKNIGCNMLKRRKINM